MTDLGFELLDQSIRLGELGALRTLVHRLVAAALEHSEFCVEFMIVEYSWIQHSSIVVDDAGARTRLGLSCWWDDHGAQLSADSRPFVAHVDPRLHARSCVTESGAVLRASS